MNLRGGVAAVLSTGPGIFAERSARRETRCFSYSPVFRPGTAGFPHAHAFQLNTGPHRIFAGVLPGFFQRVPGNIENDASHHLAGGVFPVEGNDALPVCGHEGGEVGVLRIHAQGVVKLLEEIPHHLLDSLEIQHHVIGIQRFRSEHHFHGARMAMRGNLQLPGCLDRRCPLSSSMDLQIR